MKFLAGYGYECDDCGRGPMWWERLEMWHQHVSRKWWLLWHPLERAKRAAYRAKWGGLWDLTMPVYSDSLLTSTKHSNVYEQAAKANGYELGRKGSVINFPHIESLQPDSKILDRIFVNDEGTIRDTGQHR
jgi:hypothetical protein